MSDLRLRQLQRRAAESQIAEDRAALLRERIRVGDLGVLTVLCSRQGCEGGTVTIRDGLTTPGRAGPSFRPLYGIPCPTCNGTGRVEWPIRGDAGRLALAAYCGDAVARALMGREWRRGLPKGVGLIGAYGPPDLGLWLQGLSRWPREAGVLAAVAAAEVALEAEVERRCVGGVLSWTGVRYRWISADTAAPRETVSLSRAHRAIEAARAWLADPSEANRAACYETCIVPTIPSWAWVPGGIVVNGESNGVTAPQAILHAASLTDPATVRAAIQRELVSWALAL